MQWGFKLLRSDPICCLKISWVLVKCCMFAELRQLKSVISPMIASDDRFILYMAAKLYDFRIVYAVDARFWPFCTQGWYRAFFIRKEKRRGSYLRSNFHDFSTSSSFQIFVGCQNRLSKLDNFLIYIRLTIAKVNTHTKLIVLYTCSLDLFYPASTG